MTLLIKVTFWGNIHKTLGKYTESLLSKHVKTLVSKRENSYV